MADKTNSLSISEVDLFNELSQLIDNEVVSISRGVAQLASAQRSGR